MNLGKKHALLSPSSSSKWLSSPPIARLEEIATEEYGVDDKLHELQKQLYHSIHEKDEYERLVKKIMT